MRFRHLVTAAGLILSTLVGGGPARAAAGPSIAVAAEVPQTVSIVFKLRNAQDLERFIAQSVDPQSPHFRSFYSTQDFAEAFGPRDWELATVLAFMRQNGIAIDEVYDSHMIVRATGTTAQFNALLNTVICSYPDDHGRRFQRPSRKPSVPKEIKDIVLLIAGLDTTPALHSHLRRSPQITDPSLGEAAPALVLPSGAAATGVPGNFTVGDVANLYHINPLYDRHITGQAQTLGIATLATFDPTDAYGYWSALGLHVAPNRIKEIPLDGGTGTDGADETTLDVQQAGGLAPRARILVYEAPNTTSGFLDLFYRAVSDNRVDTLSCSWGLGEAFLDADTLTAYHQAFLEAAAQGIPVFSSAGDAGAFDVNSSLPTPQFSPLNSVDHPAADPYVTAAGGTTLPITLVLRHGNIVVPQERPWGWDYLENYIVTYYGQYTYDAFYFPVGGGGGVSINFPAPSWQLGLAGRRTTSADFSTLYYYPNYTPTNPDTSGAQDLADLPIGYAGRNLPDVSLNADPETGYLLYFGGAFSNGYGGTSFVAPQLNGIAALLTQSAGSRLGFLNPQLYAIYARRGYGPKSPFNAITTGTNLYWQAIPDYNPASGLGTLDVTRLDKELCGH
ncbi:MAG: S53 family peptidase [Geothrix sp.]|nr:S53 family peptidase [Geothrix sp.]